MTTYNTTPVWTPCAGCGLPVMGPSVILDQKAFHPGCLGYSAPSAPIDNPPWWGTWKQPSPETIQGWRCPRCGAGNAPWSSRCGCVPGTPMEVTCQA